MDFIKSLFEFVVFTVIVKIIVGHWLAEQIMKYSKRWFATTERNMAIWTHYQLRAAEAGHAARNVLNCVEGNCSVFHS